MTALPVSLTWQPTQLADGLLQLGLTSGPANPARAPTTIEAALSGMMAAKPGTLVGLSCGYASLARCIADSAPMVVKAGETETAVLVVSASSRHAVLLGHDGRRQKVPLARLIPLVEPSLPQTLEANIDRLNDALESRDLHLADAFRNEHRNRQPLFIGWKLSEPAARKLTEEIRSPPILRRAGALTAVHVLHFTLWIASWMALVSALLGVGDHAGLLTVWAVALGTAMLALPVESLLQQSLATRVGVALKQHLLRSALAMDEARVRRLGIGALIARALEANRLDALASKGGIKVMLTAFDFLIVGLAFFWFSGSHPLLLLFGATIAGCVALGSAYRRAEERLHAANLSVTALHTEEMIGHRTRKAFLDRAAWHSEEDAALAAYERASAATDRIALWLGSVPRIWAVAGVALVLIDLFIQSASTSTMTGVALIGFVIIGFATLQNAVAGSMQLIKALVSFAHLATAAARDVLPPARPAALAPTGSDEGTRLIVKGLRFSYPGTTRPVVSNASLTLPSGDKVLIYGASGSGKSTLGALLAGRLEPDAGVMLSHGVDRHIVGTSRWHRYVCYVPQFTNNHVLTDTFAFNLLLGRPWPPAAEDLREAYEVARSLGLGPLIDRMPAGMMQMVGEGGWHLSQGERTRMFFARGILQGAHVLIADELLSPLDPATGLRVLDAIDRLDTQLILIAHS